MGDRPVSIMFDTGAYMFGINMNTVPMAAYTGRYVKYRTFSRRVERFPLCRMFI